MQFDILKCYESIDQKRLISILDKSIKDQIIINRLSKFFNMSIKNLNGGSFDISKSIGMFQINPLSSFLANIYLNELDHFINYLKREVGKEGGKSISDNVPEFVKAKTRKAKFIFRRELYQKKIKLEIKAGIQRKSIIGEQEGNTLDYRVYYVRYAENFLIAVKGPKWLATDIQKKTQKFLKLNLHLLLKGGDLTHAAHNSVHFLGFNIKITKRYERNLVEIKKILNFKKIRNRLLNRKKIIVKCYANYLLNIYESEKYKTLKILAGSALNKKEKLQIIKVIAQKDVLNQANAQKFFKSSSGIERYKAFLKKKRFQLKSTWIIEKELKGLSFDKVIELKENVLKVLKVVMSKKNLQSLRMKEVKRIKSNTKLKQTHVQPQGFNSKIYAPVKDLKSKLKS